MPSKVTAVAICVLSMAIAPGAYANSCDDAIKKAEKAVGNNPLEPTRLEAVEKMIRRAKTLRDQGKRRGCVNVAKRALDKAGGG